MTFVVVFTLVFLAMAGSCFAVGYSRKSKEGALKRLNSLAQKIRQANDLASGFPAQFMSHGLMDLLLRIELGHARSIWKLGDRSLGISGRIAELEEALQDPSNKVKKCRPQPVASESDAKAIRLKIQHLHALISSAMHDSIIGVDEARRWSVSLRNMRISVYIEMYTRVSAQELSARNPLKAMSTLEQGIQFLSKQPQACVYAGEIEQFKSALARAKLDAEESRQSSIDHFCQVTESIDKLMLGVQDELKQAS